MRYFINIAYNGTSFHGSQTQPNGVSVQQTFEQALATILRQPIPVTFAGRTDAGVHALEMIIHADIDETLVNRQPSIVHRLNSLLPPTIAVRSIRPVRDDAHARFSATARTYHYYITWQKDPFHPQMMTYVAPGLDFEAMNKAAQLLLGKHDFASFCKVHTDVKTTICTVTQACWRQVSDTQAEFVITADRFLRNMVRAIVGTLFDVGRHKITIEDMQSVINQHNRCAAGQSVPADGLFLAHIDYPNEIFIHYEKI